MTNIVIGTRTRPHLWRRRRQHVQL